MAFIRCDTIDTVYFDRPYYLSPSNRIAEEAFALIREGLRIKKAAALARTVLFRRVQTLLIRPHGDGLVGTTLNFDYEVRSAEEAFHDIPAMTIKGEMLDLAKHIITTKRGAFDPGTFDDRYEAALAELVRAKLEGTPLPIRKAPAQAKVVDLMEALRQSAGAAGTGKRGRAAKAKPGSATSSNSGTPSAKKTAGKQKPTGKQATRTRRPGAGGKPADPTWLSRPTAASATSRRRRSRAARRSPPARVIAISSRSTLRGACTTTFGSRWTVC